MRMLILTLALLLRGALFAQPTVAPTTEQVGEVRRAAIGPYNVIDRFEFGYRCTTVGGNLGAYRSDVNFGNGPRVLGGRFALYSKDGHGRWFDEMVLTTIGFGNDPYQSASLRVQRNGLYRYDLQWRLSEYYNPGLAVAGGLHRIDTVRRLQDHDLTLFPQSRARLFLGYSRNAQDGPALSTVQLFDGRGDEFPLMTDVRRLRNEYRLGGDLAFSGMRLTLMRGWESFREDTPYLQDQASAGANPNDLTTLTSFRRGEPSTTARPPTGGRISRRKRAAGSPRAVASPTRRAAAHSCWMNRPSEQTASRRRATCRC